MSIANIQMYLTPAMSKRLIALGVAGQDCVQEKLEKGTIVVTGGTTNSYVAEEMLRLIGEDIGSLKNEMMRGVITPPGVTPVKAKIVDVVIVDGKWQKDKSFAEIVDTLQEGDVIIKGGNAVHVETGDVGVLMGSDTGGTLSLVTRAVYGKRVKVIAPVGMEKRVNRPITELTDLINEPGMKGERLGIVPGKAYTEVDAIFDLTSCDSELIAAGGVMGAEGTCVFQAVGEEEDVALMEKLYEKLKEEKNFTQE